MIQVSELNFYDWVQTFNKSVDFRGEIARALNSDNDFPRKENNLVEIRTHFLVKGKKIDDPQLVAISYLWDDYSKIYPVKEV